MNIIKRHRNLLVCFSVIASLLSSCLPVMDSVTLVGFKNCTNDTLIIGESDYDNIDSTCWFGERIDRPSKEPLLISIRNIDMTYCDTVITPKEQAKMAREGMITYPDSFFYVNEGLLFHTYFFLIKLEDAKNHSWDEIRAKKLYKKWNVVRNKYGGYDTNIKYSE